MLSICSLSNSKDRPSWWQFRSTCMIQTLRFARTLRLIWCCRRRFTTGPWVVNIPNTWRTWSSKIEGEQNYWKVKICLCAFNIIDWGSLLQNQCEQLRVSCFMSVLMQCGWMNYASNHPSKTVFSWKTDIHSPCLVISSSHFSNLSTPKTLFRVDVGRAGGSAPWQSGAL